MPFVELNGMNDLKEPTLAPDGDYNLAITSAEAYVNDKGRDVIKTRIEFEDHPEYAGFYHWVALPNMKLDVDEHPEGPEEGKKKYERMQLGVKRFLEQWGIPYDNGFATEDLNGARTHAYVTIEARDDDPTKSNQRLITPRLES